MGVYVDNYNASFGRMKMCHMVADSTEELLKMVDEIGVKRKWIQHPNTYKEHFDICLSNKEKAIKLGAEEINFRKYVEFCNKRKINK